jgi:phenylacetate-CoA ligase
LASLKQTDFLSENELKDIQFHEVKCLLNHAYQTTKYYKELFDSCEFRPDEMKDLKEISKIPFLTKEIIKERHEELVSNRFSESQREYASTGGSTGLPLGFYQEKNMTSARENAFITHVWGRAGYSPGTPLMKIRRNLGSYHSQYNPLWFYDHANNHVIFSGHHLDPDSLSKFVGLTESFQAEFIWTYPSTAAAIANFLIDNKIQIKAPIKGVLLSSENIYDKQKEWIERAFSARVFGLYGNTERTVLASHCELSSNYHVYPEYGYTELIDKNGLSVKTDGKMGEVISTGFNNYVMPFIRYKTGDLAVYSSKKCKCGRATPLWKRIEGRMQELALSKNGMRITIGPTLLCNIPDQEYAKIRQLQIVQKSCGELIVRIVKEKNYKEAEAVQAMQRLFDERFQGLFDIQFEFVDYLEKTEVNKSKFFIQEISTENI